MIKKQELASQILEMINTAIEASEQLLLFLEQGNRADFNEVSEGLRMMVESIQKIADELKKEEDGLNLPAASASVLDSLSRVIAHASKDTKKAIHKIEFELIPLVEEMRVNFFYWGTVYPDPVKMKKYYEEDIHWLANNRYLEKSIQTGQFKYDLSIIVVAYNKLDYTKQCITELLKHLPKNLSYELIMVNHGSSDGTKEFFEKISPNKQVDIAVNGGGVGAIYRIVEGRYEVTISNDVLVTKNAIENMYRCISSDEKNAWVVPTTPNVSNLQSIQSDYNDMAGLSEFAEKNNVSDDRRWEQRVRLCNPIDIMSTKFLQQVKPYHWYQSKNFFSFPDDRLSLLCRRNGYKLYLAKDAFCHHFGSVTLKKDEKTNAEAAFLKGRQDFFQFFGVDPWGIGFCFDPYLFNILECNKTGDVSVLGINCGFGSNSLKIKEELKEKVGNTTVYLKNITTNETVIEDLKGVSDEAIYVKDYHILQNWEEQYDYIVADSDSHEVENLVSDITLFFEKSKSKGIIVMLLSENEVIRLQQEKALLNQFEAVDAVQGNNGCIWGIFKKY